VGRDDLIDLVVDEKIILKWVLNIDYEFVTWIYRLGLGSSRDSCAPGAPSDAIT
jgi:hypothetical protein